jgi:hypothetical protein
MHLLLTALALLAPVPLPDADLTTVREAGRQLVWAGRPERGRITLYTRPTAGGTVRRLGTVPSDGGTASAAFDGTRYAMAFSTVTGVDTSGENCGICENTLALSQQVIAGTLAGPPKVVARCSDGEVDAPPAEVAIAAGRTFFADACPGGIREVAVASVDPAARSAGTREGRGASRAGVGLDHDVRGAGTPAHPGATLAGASLDPDGRAPLRGAGTWLAYGRPRGTRVLDLAGPSDYAAPPAREGLLVQEDGSVLVDRAFYRTGGTAPPVALRSASPNALLAGDRLFADDLEVTSARGTAALVVPGLAAKRALSLAGSTLRVAGYSCTGKVIAGALDLAAAAPGGVDGCPVTLGSPRLTKPRTVTVSVRCPNGCAGTLRLASATAKVRARPGARTTVRFRLRRPPKKRVRLSSTSPWLTVPGSARRVRSAR